MLSAQITSYTKDSNKNTHNGPYTLNPATPLPAPSSPHDMLVRIAVASHCHTDGMVRAGVFGTSLPCIGSHEGSGTVVYAGPSAQAAPYNFKSGDRVMCGLPLRLCGTCEDCTAAGRISSQGQELGQEQYCVNVAGHVGVHVDGCFAEYVLVDARSTTHIPDSVSLVEAAPLACAGRTVWRAVDIAIAEATQLLLDDQSRKSGPSDKAEESRRGWLAIVGAGGGLGHLGVQFAKARGWKVIAIEARDEGLEISRDAGADATLDARIGKENLVEQVEKVVSSSGSQGDGADATITLADVDDAAALGCAVTRMHGTMVQIAQPEQVKIPFHELVFRDIRIRGSVLCSAGESREMMRFIEQHRDQIKVRIVPFWGLEKVNELVESVERGEVKGKAVVIVDREQVEREHANSGL